MPTIQQKELTILEYWKRDLTFQKSVRRDAPNGDFTFYDGPPFATGTPHYGHIVASVMKDAIPRYWTMRGYRVERRWGWDCHGLPVENIAEKELHFKDKRDIEAYGIAKFNDYCKVLVMRYVNEWRSTVERIGRWVDLDNDYKTMNPEYMESIWWVFKALWDKGLVYRGYKSMHMCPRCGTTLSNFEVTQNYKDIEDLSVTVKFELIDEPGTYVLAWTTTPWTLIGNVALAIGPTIVYVKVKTEKGIYILAEDRLAATVTEPYEMLGKVSAAELTGKRYRPLFDFYQNGTLDNFENGWKIYEAPFVTTDEGTGVVHIAPAFGEEDMELGKQMRLPFIQHVDEAGQFKSDVTLWPGMVVKPSDDVQASDRKIIEHLKTAGALYAEKAYTHSYPHCWRCETPLLNYAADSWFVAVTKIKDDLLKNNQDVHWYPDHLRDGRFGKWLEQARDWAISRNRYWGTPLPVWICEHCGQRRVIGSRREIEEASNKKVPDLHKQFVDDIVIPCSACTGPMHRIPEVFDCWFESGSMPYAEEHYPFEQKDHFESHFPADYIAEGVDQTRGWFYTLMVLSTALFNKPVAKYIMVNGIVLAEDGAKMSKSKKNFPDPNIILDRYGADALRFYLLSSPVMQAENMNFSERDLREVYNKVISTLHNVVSFYTLYATASIPDVVSDHVLDRWVMARVTETVTMVTRELDAFDTVRSARLIGACVQDVSTWYVRRSRDRMKDPATQAQALGTLRSVLIILAKISAPFIPFSAEYVWQTVTGSPDSVHLEAWPTVTATVDQQLLDHMGHVRQIVERAHALRAIAGIKVRQPLPQLAITTKLSDELGAVIAAEVNVKDVAIVGSLPSANHFKRDETGTVALDVTISKTLANEGMLREIIRSVNALRKEHKLSPSDTIVVHYATGSSILADEVIAVSMDHLCRQTIAREWRRVENLAGGTDIDVNGEQVTIQLINGD